MTRPSKNFPLYHNLLLWLEWDNNASEESIKTHLLELARGEEDPDGTLAELQSILFSPGCSEFDLAEAVCLVETHFSLDLRAPVAALAWQAETTDPLVVTFLAMDYTKHYRSLVGWCALGGEHARRGTRPREYTHRLHLQGSLETSRADYRHSGTYLAMHPLPSDAAEEIYYRLCLDGNPPGTAFEVTQALCV